MKNLIHKIVTYSMGLTIITMIIVVATDRKQIRELKNNYQESINAIDSLYMSSIDPSVMWFENQVPTKYEVMEHAVMNYDWGKEVVIFFKYKENEKL